MPTKKLKVKKAKVVKKPEAKVKPIAQIKSTQGHVIMGLVVESKLPKTVTVLINRVKMHPLYKKSVKRSKKYLVHDEVGAQEGDLIEMVKCRPYSKRKHWKILSIIGRDIELMETEALKVAAGEAIAEVMPEEKVEEIKEEINEEKIEKPKAVKKEKK